jgi:hypothetical protein
MPLTGNPEIDANIEKARNKKERDRKLKILLGKSTSTPKKKKKALKEGMTSSGMFFATLAAQGDVDIAQFAFPVEALGSDSGYSQSGNNYTFGPAGSGVPPAETSSLTFEMNSEIYDTIVFDYVGSGLIDEFIVVTGDDGGLSTYNVSTSSGQKVVRLVQADRRKLVSISFSLKRNAGGGLGTNKILNVSFQRRQPVNVFVGLDDPTANAFIRDGQADNLSPSQKKKKIEEMLRASNSYMNIQIGDVTPKTATEIADYEPQQSFSDVVSDARNPMGTGDQAAAPAALLASPMVQAAAAKGIAALASLVGGMGLAKQIMNSIRGTDWGAAPGMDKVGDWDKNPNPGLHKDLTPQQQAEVEAANKELRDAGRAWGDIRSNPDATDAQRDMAKERYDRASKNRQRLRKKHREENKNRKESYKSNGLYISENKRLKSPKDLADKIPGYYDGKPAPLGFPIVEPPKMKDGMHPDLVDGKKVAKRFNRLDPISAKAMPPTGNPHIDKKVKAAAKKPK